LTLTFSRRIGTFIFDRRVLLLLVLAGLFIAGRSWLAAHPEHNPWAPLDLNDPKGWATQQKLVALRDDVPTCRAVLERSEVPFDVLEPAGEGKCRREDRTRLFGYPLTPEAPATTCLVAVAMELWKRDTLDPAAQELFGSEVASLEHLGSYSCRRLYGRNDGPWSEHATANALDIAGFVLEDGTRISVLSDWQSDGDKQRFLREARDGACGAFSTVLSPDYNAAHADHFHFDMDDRWTGVCR
jgi:hypothetical protein